MSSKAFASYPTEAKILTIATLLLEEHAASRLAATMAKNVVCGNCAGSGVALSSLTDREETCWACLGDGKPNDKFQSLPALEPSDHERLYKITQLMQGPHGKAVIDLVRRYMPDTFNSEGRPN